ncbi:MAG: PIN domain-containing protein [Candidatus Rokubacteria bacterium]|nr:PIN domain-containing protein [Candidatus Rokubacteria bacterium]
MPDRVLVDTSVWVDFFRNLRAPVGETISALLRRGEACYTGLIEVELYRGAKGQAELDSLDILFKTIQRLPVSDSLYRKAGQLCYRLARKGITVGTVDAMIATVALEYNCRLLSLDQHFREIQPHCQLKLIAV